MIRAALPSEAATLSALALRSKAHWHYSAEQLEVFREELVIGPDEIQPKRVHVFAEHAVILGFYSLSPLPDRVMELEHLFVEPAAHGRGMGSRLFAHACASARSAGFESLVIQSDPNAEGFYRRLGARFAGSIPSSIPGRSLPRFVFPLK
jgi:GNAT superfamily N-acetyltransferase